MTTHCTSKKSSSSRRHRVPLIICLLIHCINICHYFRRVKILLLTLRSRRYFFIVNSTWDLVLFLNRYSSPPSSWICLSVTLSQPPAFRVLWGHSLVSSVSQDSCVFGRIGLNRDHPETNMEDIRGQEWVVYGDYGNCRQDKSEQKFVRQ